MRLSLCMIVRDSARTLGPCLESIRPWVDEIIVVDTGSIDDTREIAKGYGSRLYEFLWCDDFSAARNESLKYAAGEWLFWMDSDDTISPENGRKLRSLVDGAILPAITAYVMQVHCPGPAGSSDCTVVDHVKLFRNDPRLRFEGRIHEQILPAIREIDGTVEWTNIYVTHSGSEHSPEARKRKQQRDLRILELDLADRPNHPFVLFNLGMTYADMNEAEQAADYLKHSLGVSGPDESHVRKAYALLVGCLVQSDKDDEARRILGRACELFPDDAELSFRLGILEQRAGNYDRAIEAYQAALNEPPNRIFTSRDYGITGHKARHNLAGIFRDCGKPDHAELQWRLALSDEPNYRDGWRGLVDTLLDQRRFVTLEVEIEGARDQALPPEEITWATARLAVARGDIEGAIAIIDASASDGEMATDLLSLKCQLLYEHSTADRSIGALEELCRRCPEDGAVWHNLGTAHQKSGCGGLAITCYQKSLTFRPKSAATLLQLGYAQYELGRIDAAKRSWQSAQVLTPNDPIVAAAVVLIPKTEQITVG